MTSKLKLSDLKITNIEVTDKTIDNITIKDSVVLNKDLKVNGTLRSDSITPITTTTFNINGSLSVNDEKLKTWVLKWTGNSVSVANQWGNGRFLLVLVNGDYVVENILLVRPELGTKSIDTAWTNTSYASGYNYQYSGDIFGRANTSTACYVREIYKWE